VGWIYGSITEDVLTGLTIHEKGWRSELCTPSPIPFTGFAPGGGPTSMAQQKRWATGMLEIFICKHCPIISSLFRKLTLRQCLAYMWIINWGLQPVFEVCYACLLAYCIITNSNFLPQVSIQKMLKTKQTNNKNTSTKQKLIISFIFPRSRQFSLKLMFNIVLLLSFS